MYKYEEEYTKIVTKNYFLTKKITDLGITKKYTAYYFLLDILDEIINKQRIIKSFSREVYPGLASKYGKHDCSIERDIRNLIATLWDRKLKDKLAYFYSGEGKPTCNEFIYLIKNYILADIV